MNYPLKKNHIGLALHHFQAQSILVFQLVQEYQIAEIYPTLKIMIIRYFGEVLICNQKVEKTRLLLMIKQWFTGDCMIKAFRGGILI